jgi:hypothetical protein
VSEPEGDLEEAQRAGSDDPCFYSSLAHGR